MAMINMKVILIFVCTISTAFSVHVTISGTKPQHASQVHHDHNDQTELEANEANAELVSDLVSDSDLNHENLEPRNVDAAENEVKSALPEKANKVDAEFPPIFWDRMAGEGEQLNNEEYKSRLSSALENVKAETTNLEKVVQEGKVDMNTVLEIGDLHNIVSVAESKHN